MELFLYSSVINYVTFTKRLAYKGPFEKVQYCNFVPTKTVIKPKRSYANEHYDANFEREGSL